MHQHEEGSKMKLSYTENMYSKCSRTAAKHYAAITEQNLWTCARKVALLYAALDRRDRWNKEINRLYNAAN